MIELLNKLKVNGLSMTVLNRENGEMHIELFRPDITQRYGGDFKLEDIDDIKINSLISKINIRTACEKMSIK